MTKYKEELEKAVENLSSLEEKVAILEKSLNSTITTFAYTIHLLGDKLEIDGVKYAEFIQTYTPKVFYRYLKQGDGTTYVFEYSVMKKDEFKDFVDKETNEKTDSGV